MVVTISVSGWTRQSSSSTSWQLTQCRSVSESFTVQGLMEAYINNNQATYSGPRLDHRWEMRIYSTSNVCWPICDHTYKTKIHTSFKYTSGERYLGITLRFQDYPEAEKMGRRRHYSAKWELQVMKQRIAKGSFPVRCPIPGFEFEAPQACKMSKIASMVEAEQHQADLDRSTLTFEITEHPDDYDQQTLGMTPSFLSVTMACAQLFDDPMTADVCFVIHHPSMLETSSKKIFAHSKILSSRLPYFATMFKDVYSESTGGTDNNAAEDNLHDDWDGSSDSDYDDSEEDLSNDVPSMVESMSALNNATTAERADAAVDLYMNASQSKSTAAVDRVRKEVHILDSSYRTYHAFLLYLYSGSIAFAPLKSTYLAESTKRASFLRTEKYHQSRRQYNSAHATVVAHVPGIELPWTSAKSIYRLADKVDVPELTSAAWNHLKASITAENIAREIMSSFSKAYPKVQEMQIDYLRSHWKKASRSDAFERVIFEMIGHPATSNAWLGLLRELDGPSKRKATK